MRLRPHSLRTRLLVYLGAAIALVVGASLGEETVTGWTLGGLAFVLMVVCKHRGTITGRHIPQL
mgnify:CR=1 FL=1